MSGFCSVTGNTPCHCPKKNAVTSIGSALLVDFKAALRKIFTDHGVYTLWLILESLPSQTPFSDVVTKRLLQNPKDISNLLVNIIGKDAAFLVQQLFTEHLILASKTFEPAKNGDQVTLNNILDKLYSNGDKIGEALASLNPVKLPIQYAKQLMRVHNEQVVQMVVKRLSNDISIVELYDHYYKHLLMMSDAIYEAFTN
jgi:hypothetical protein